MLTLTLIHIAHQITP